MSSNYNGPWSKATSPLYENVQLGKPGIRVWDIKNATTASSSSTGNNITSFDRQRAAPSDDTLHKV